MAVEDTPEVGLNVDAKPWSPSSDDKKKIVVKVAKTEGTWGSGLKVPEAKDESKSSASEGMDDELVADPFANTDNFSWGLQALTGMAESMFPEDDEKSPHSASPAHTGNHTPNNQAAAEVKHHPWKPLSPKTSSPRNTVSQPAPSAGNGTWSPTIAHTLIEQCPPEFSIDDGMSHAYERLKTEVAVSVVLSSRNGANSQTQIPQGALTGDKDLESAAQKASSSGYNEEILLRLHRVPRPMRGIPLELLVSHSQEPELLRKYPNLVVEPQPASSPKWGIPHKKRDHHYNHYHNNHHHYHHHYHQHPHHFPPQHMHNQYQQPYYQEYHPMHAQHQRYFGGKGRKQDCHYYHDPAMYGTMQAAYEEELQKQNEIEQGYELAIAAMMNDDMMEKRRDAEEGAQAADKTVYIVGIDSATTDENVLIRLSQFGSIRKYQLCGDPNQPTRYGFFEYNTVAGCRNCQVIDGKKMFTRPIRVSKAKDAIKGGRNIPDMHQMELLRAAAICSVQRIEAPCPKGTGRHVGNSRDHRGAQHRDNYQPRDKAPAQPPADPKSTATPEDAIPPPASNGKTSIWSRRERKKHEEAEADTAPEAEAGAEKVAGEDAPQPDTQASGEAASE